jgi:dipeptidase D
MKITDLQPTIVWKFFHQITQVPRPSKKEGKIIAYLEAFAKEYHIAIKKDAVGNILMSKPATPGFENRPTVVLQSHVDMVCEKNSDKVFDFDKDAIETIVDGEWLRANGTTLGADNGIGVAAELAILSSKDIEHGPLECLFTVDEETGLTGASALQAGFLTGKILLNLDSEDEGEIFIGCAGGKGTKAEFVYQATPTPSHRDYFRIDVKGLKGGHSGCDINLGLGNANKILVRILNHLIKDTDLTLCHFDGGNLHNAIPREAYAVIGLPQDAKEGFITYINRFTAEIENEFKHTDPKVQIEVQSVDRPDKSIDPQTALALILSIEACPHGVLSMSHDIEGLVETSTNLASVKTLPGSIVIGTSQRSSVESRKKDASNQVAAVFQLAGAKVEQGEGYPGWAPNPDSPVLKVARETYMKLYNKEPKIMAIHAGLECGLFLEKYPYLDMISFGPTLRDVHSPNERILIPTVSLWWAHLLELLKS